ncbi:MAG TPA: SDR family oxidoreductase [Acidobacteriota bacterium]|nr:SDR family oxidoreductase [Acidobacteriota bacterium]
MRVLVTGHLGYIGTVMAPILIEAGHDVVGLDSDFYDGCTFGEDFQKIPSLQKDIRDVAHQDLKGFDAVIHLAALSNDPLGNLNPSLTFEINYEATVRLATFAKEAGVQRFLFSSSCSNYGAAGDRILTEEAGFNPVTPYGESKVLAEKGLRKLASDRFSVTSLRSTTAYGLSPRLRFDIVLNNLVAWAFTTGLVYLKSDGTPWRPIVHVEDICRAFLAVLHAPSNVVNDQAFNVGITSENYQIKDLARIVKETVPGSRVEFAENAGPDKRSYRVDFEKIVSALPDFRPRWNAQLGAAELYNAYKKYGLKLEDFEGARYRRVDRIQNLLATGRLDPTLRWQEQPSTAKS